MPPLAVGLWLANVLLDVIGRIAFKAAAIDDGAHASAAQRWQRLLRTPSLWAGVACFVLEFVAWLALVSLIPLSQAVLIGTINIAGVAIAGRLLFGETLHPRRIAAIALIAVGVALAGGGG